MFPGGCRCFSRLPKIGFKEGKNKKNTRCILWLEFEAQEHAQKKNICNRQFESRNIKGWHLLFGAILIKSPVHTRQEK